MLEALEYHVSQESISGMRLTFLGTASGVPVGNRNSSSLLAASGDASVLFDCGEGVTQTLLRGNVNLHSIQRIYLSHTHPDHVAGLPMLLQGMHLSKRKQPLHIITDSRNHVWLLEMLRGMFLIPTLWDFPVNVADYSFEDFPGGEWLHVTASGNSHLAGAHHLAEEHGVTPACYSFHLKTASHNIFLSSDIGSIDDVKPHLDSADTAVIEATHVAPETLFELAREKSAVRFVFTHIPPELDARITGVSAAAEEEFGARVQFAYDGCSLDIPEDAAVD